MANLELTLSAKSREDGKSQVLVRISRGRDIRFRYKSGVYVTPSFWNDAEQSIKVPISRKTNKAIVDAAKTEKSMLDNFIADLNSIINASEDADVKLSAEWIDHCLALRPILEDSRNGFSSSKIGGIFTAANIERAAKLVDDLKAAETRKVEEQEQSKRLYDLIPDYCRARNLAPSRVKVYKVLARLLGRYEMFVQLTDKSRKDYSLIVSKVCSDDVEEFRDYMRNEGSLQDDFPKVFKQILERYPQTENPTFRNRTIQDRGENYICVSMKRLKAVVNWCRETGRTEIDAFRGVEIGSEQYGRPIYISREERDLIADFDLSEQPIIMQQQRDIFVFQCCVGCRVSDLYSLTSDNIQDGMLRYSPSKTEDKTGAIARVPLNSRAVAILQKYDGVDKQGRILPFVSEQRYNDYIKSIFAVCDITRKVLWRNPTTGKTEVRGINEIASTHLARRTFVGGIYKQVKDPNLIGAMSGHAEGSKAFARYRDIGDDDLIDVMNAVE